MSKIVDVPHGFVSVSFVLRPHNLPGWSPLLPQLQVPLYAHHSPKPVLRTRVSFLSSSPAHQILHVKAAGQELNLSQTELIISASHPANPLLISILVTSTPETLLLKHEIWTSSLISLPPHISRQSPCFIVFNHLIISLPYCHCYCLNLGLLFCKDSFSSPASMFTLLTSPSTV